MKKNKKILNLSKEQIDYIKYNTGVLSNKFIAKKLKIKINLLYYAQSRLDIGITKSFFGYDYLQLKEVSNELAIPIYKVKQFHKMGIIEIKKISKFSIISFDDMEKIIKFLTEYLDIKQVKNILKLKSRQSIKYVLKKYGIKKYIFNENIFFYLKSDILELKQKLKYEGTLSLKEFAEKTHYSITHIFNLCKKNILHNDRVGKQKNIRIDETELIKLLQVQPNNQMS